VISGAGNRAAVVICNKIVDDPIEQDRATSFGDIASSAIWNNLRMGARRENCRGQQEQGELVDQKSVSEQSAHTIEKN
jgi:hypothetical protein